MEYTGETGRKLKIRLKEDETDSKVDFRKKSGKKKKYKLSSLSEHLKTKKHQLDQSSIKILAKENNYWKRRSKEAHFITKHRGASRMRAGQGIWILRQGILGHFRPL